MVGVTGHVHLLNAGDEVPAPVELIGLQRRERGVGGGVGGKLDLPDRRGALPEVRARLERDSPTLLQIALGTMYTWPAMFCRLAYCGVAKLTVTVSPVLDTPLIDRPVVLTSAFFWSIE
jgi:hypothetical protein